MERKAETPRSGGRDHQEVGAGSSEGRSGRLDTTGDTSTEPSSLTLFVSRQEPPYTEPYVRWCERTAGATPPPTRSCRQPPATRTGQTRASLASQPHAPGSTKIQGFLGRDYRRARNGEARCTAMQNGLLVLCEGAHARSITTHPSALNCSIDICLPYARILLEIEGGSDAQPLLTCVAFGGRAHHTGL